VAGLTLLSGVGLVPRTAAADDEPVPPEPRRFTMALTGDILAHVDVNKQAWKYGGRTTYDYRPMFADIQPLIEGADLAICHLEGPIAPAGTRITGQPVFGSPAPIVASIADVGYDRCSLASNHSLDRGTKGVTATLDAFDASGLGASGTARTAEEAVEPIIEVNGVRVVHLAYSYEFNGRRRGPKGETWWANLINPDRILADAADARTRGAEVVVVSLHWGTEYRSKPTTTQRRLANTLTASGLVDLIVGHHAHVLQPIEQVNGKWVLYGLGNILSNQRPSRGTPAPSQDGVVVTVEVTENPDGTFTVGRPVATPTFMYYVPKVALDVRAHLDDPALPKWVRNELKRSLTRSTKVLGAYFPA